MNIHRLLAFYFLNSQAQFSDRDINRDIADSLAFVVENFFTQRSSSFVFVLSCERQHTMNFFNDLFSELFRHWYKTKMQIVVNSEVPGQSGPGERMFNLLLVDSWRSFLKIDPASKVANYDSNEFYFVFLQNRDRFHAEDIQKILEYCWRNYIINVNIQVQKASGDIVIFTYFPFTASHCRKVIPVEINRFQNGTMLNDLLFPSKVDNMYGCPVRVATWNIPPYLSLDLSKTGRDALGGFEGLLLVQLSEMMNFGIEIIVPPNNEQRGLISENKPTGAARMLKRREADLSLGSFWPSLSRRRILTPSDLYYQVSNEAVFLTIPSYYSPIQALWFPFSPEATVGLIASFVLTLITFLGLSWFSRRYFPTSVRHPNIFLNYISCTLGLSSLMQTTRISTRIFVMAWMLFSLVIRTEYGAIIYHFIRNNLFRQTPKTLDDLVRLNYIFALMPTSYQAFAETSIFADTGLSHIIVNQTYPGGMLKYLEDNKNARLFNISPIEFILYTLAKAKKIGKLSTLNKSFLIQNSCIFFTKHSFLVDHVNALIQQIKSVGLMEAWVESSIDWSFVGANKAPTDVKIGLEELKSVNRFCGLMLAVAFLVFCVELLSVKIKHFRRFL